jgi:hypothetical protein
MTQQLQQLQLLAQLHIEDINSQDEGEGRR